MRGGSRRPFSYTIKTEEFSMVIFRTKPASIQYEGILIFPGAQFMSDQTFDYLKNKYPDFVKETKGPRAFIQILVKPSEPAMVDDPEFKADPKIKDQKTPKVKTWPKAKKTLGEEVLALDVDAAVSVIQEIIDEEELRDVQVADNRREVRDACVRQWDERSSAMQRLAPRAIASPNRDVVNKPIFTSDDPVVQGVVKEFASGRA